MEKLAITTEIIKDILRNKESLSASIQDRMYNINRAMKNANEIIEVVSFRSSEFACMPKGKGGHTDLTKTYLDYQKALRQRSADYKNMVYELILKEESMERVWQCYMVLSEPYYSVLTAMYVKNQKYEIAEKESGFSRQVFEKYRKAGIELIKQLYESDKSVAELMEFSICAKQKRAEVKNRQVFNQENYQISLDDYLQGFKE